MNNNQPNVLIVGRTNVGKSRLFNALVGKKVAIVLNQEHVTRDYQVESVDWNGYRLNVVDTVGYFDAEASTDKKSIDISLALFKQAQVLVCVVDGRLGLTPLDKHFLKLCYQTGLPLILAVNKCEGESYYPYIPDFQALNLNTHYISSEHGLNIYELQLDIIDSLVEQKLLTKAPYDPEAITPKVQKPIQISIVGQPNVGKSTLINNLLGYERLVTHDEKGTTRDSVAIPFEYNGMSYLLYDTAGLAKKQNKDDTLNYISFVDSLNAIKFSECVVMMIDPTKHFLIQDQKILDSISKEGRALVIVINKADVFKADTLQRNNIIADIQKRLPQLGEVVPLFISAKMGDCKEALFKAIHEALRLWNRKFTTAKLNQWLIALQNTKPHPMKNGRSIRFKYMTQTGIRPPSFVIFCNRKAELEQSYERYLIRQFRQSFNLPYGPIRFDVKEANNPYLEKKRKPNNS